MIRGPPGSQLVQRGPLSWTIALSSCPQLLNLSPHATRGSHASVVMLEHAADGFKPGKGQGQHMQTPSTTTSRLLALAVCSAMASVLLLVGEASAQRCLAFCSGGASAPSCIGLSVGDTCQIVQGVFGKCTAFGGGCCSCASGGGQQTFKARLTGAEEVPPVTTDMTGKVRIKFNKAETEAEFELTVNDGVRVTAAHLHCAPTGVNGPIIVFLAGLHAAGLNVDGKWISNATMTDTSIVNTACGSSLAAIAESVRQGMVYVNVHTVANPGGEIRGQLDDN